MTVLNNIGNRRGEKIGWIAGWLGGFIWVAGLSLVFLYQQIWLQGLMGLLLFCAAIVSITFLAALHQGSHRRGYVYPSPGSL